MKILWGAKFFWCPFFADVFFEMLCGGFFEMLCGWVGCQDWLCCFLKCFAAGWGTKIRFAHLVRACGGD